MRITDDDEADAIRIQIIPTRQEVTTLGFNLAIFDPAPYMNNNQSSGIKTADHFTLPPDVGPDRVLLWYNYPPDARDRLMRINPQAPTAAAQEQCIQEYLGGPDTTEEVRLATIGNKGGAIDMAVFPMSIHPTAEIAREIQRRGCIDHINCAQEEVGQRLDFLAEGTVYTNMRCCPISDLESIPAPVVGKNAMTKRFDFTNPNPPSMASAGNPQTLKGPPASTGTLSSGSITPSSTTGTDITAFEAKFTNFLQIAETRINQQISSITTNLEARTNQKMQQYRDLLRDEIQAGQERVEDRMREAQIEQGKLTAQVRNAEARATEAAESSRVGLDALQKIMMASIQQQNELRLMMVQTQQNLQLMQAASSTPAQEESKEKLVTPPAHKPPSE